MKGTKNTTSRSKAAKPAIPAHPLVGEAWKLGFVWTPREETSSRQIAVITRSLQEPIPDVDADNEIIARLTAPGLDEAARIGGLMATAPEAHRLLGECLDVLKAPRAGRKPAAQVRLIKKVEELLTSAHVVPPPTAAEVA
jgi:hypothetical protein